jgi:hypothetical protein
MLSTMVFACASANPGGHVETADNQRQRQGDMHGSWAEVDSSQQRIAADASERGASPRMNTGGKRETKDPSATASTDAQASRGIDYRDIASRKARKKSRLRACEKGGPGDCNLGATRTSPPVVASRGGALKGLLCFVPAGLERLADLGGCKPDGVMYTDVLNITPRRFTHGFPGVSPRTKWFAIDYRGGFSVRRSGEYLFRLVSQDGSILLIDGKSVIDNDGIHGPQGRTSRVELSEGTHTIRVMYLHADGSHVALQLFVTPPGQAEKLWGPDI